MPANVIDKLTLHMNKVRQAAITKEIIEVVSGAASAGKTAVGIRAAVCVS